MLRITGNRQKLEETRKDPPLEPAEGPRPCSPFDRRLLASRTVRGGNSVVQTARFVALCGSSPRTLLEMDSPPRSLSALDPEDYAK